MFSNCHHGSTRVLLSVHTANCTRSRAKGPALLLVSRSHRETKRAVVLSGPYKLRALSVRGAGPLPCRLLFFSLRTCQKPCTEGGFKRLWFFFMNNEKGSPCPDKKRVGELSDTVRTLVWLSWPFFTKVIFKMNIKCSFSWLIMMRKWHIVSTAITFFGFRPKKAILKSKLDQNCLNFNFECQNF